MGKDGNLFICKYYREKLCSTSFSSVLAMNFFKKEKYVEPLKFSWSYKSAPKDLLNNISIN